MFAATQSRPSLYTLPFWLLSTSNFLFSASFSMMIPELPAYLEGMGGREYVGLIIALFTLTAGLSRPFSGKLTDRIGRVPVMAFGSVVCFVCGFMYPLALSVWGFLLLRLIHGFSTGTKPTATAAYVADVVPADRRGEAMGALGLFTATGMSLGPAIGSWLAESFSLNVMFYTSSAFALLSILILLRMPETLTGREPFRWGLLKLKADELFDRNARWPFWILLLLSFSSGAVLTVIPALSMKLGVANKGLFFTVYTIASLVVRVLFARTSDRYGRVPVLLVSSGALAVAMGMLVLAGLADAAAPVWFWAGCVVYGLSWGMNSPTVQAWTADLSDEHTRGRAMATMYIALEAGIGLGAVVAGWLYNHMAGGTQASFAASALLALVSVGALWWRWCKK
ncbi:MFS transporter [Rudanella paleaurantiibacter]|uniref:MFS transporter n=1 Tax=Rudanella paleaurantiibacter TaxID=2614655 RepID=A0A7J5U5E8_9BACT|nr:MFS transporter [Rudanella paleaurantiibacter]KAB7733064.1 MFS transporter [Rudanella paleaurantiibacter]